MVLIMYMWRAELSQYQLLATTTETSLEWCYFEILIPLQEKKATKAIINEIMLSSQCHKNDFFFFLLEFLKYFCYYF